MSRGLGTQQFQIQGFDKNGQPYRRLMTTTELETQNIYMTPDQLAAI